MQKENKNSPNAVKYSIWETKIDEAQLKAKQKITESIQETNLDSSIMQKQE